MDQWSQNHPNSGGSELLERVVDIHDVGKVTVALSGQTPLTRELCLPTQPKSELAQQTVDHL